MRRSGILLPISSLPSKYGIGCFSKEAYEFVDGLSEAHQHFWQILPLGQTSFGDSPYQSFSTFAGNPYFIDLEKLIEEGMLTKEECEECDFGDDDRTVDYGKIYEERYDLLWCAFERSNIEENDEFKKFVKENEDWLPDYALYMAIKDSFEGIAWTEWEEDVRLRKKEALDEYREELEDDILFYEFLQFKFVEQWMKLKKYANDKGIEIIGDIPIYVAFDSADCWSDTKLFQFNSDNVPIAVAGCPPDAFAADGQLWGNPLYDWDYHKKTGYEWWIRRVQYSLRLYDVVRIDHFRGFDEYYSIPYGDKTAKNGKWEKGPGIDLFKSIEDKLGKLNIIAEDLGYLTDTVEKLVKDTGYPGMKLIQFAFDSREQSNYLPHTYEKNTIVYTGTHDNDTLVGWYDSISEEDREYALDYMNNRSTPKDKIYLDFIRMAMASVSDTAIIPLQDYLGLGSEARINIPSTLGGNWTWRMLPGELDKETISLISQMTKVYERDNA